ncbi:hypothetical protein [Pseudomonas citronellolis]|uniref:hypothetical protein n=1 Tax=Pseudomonas citronellolis TaxID=53408 RepID=UPI002FDAD1A4
MITLWRVRLTGCDIREIKAERVEGNFMWVNGHQLRMLSCMHQCFRSWAAAHKHLVAREQKRLERAKAEKLRAEAALLSLESMKKGDSDA